MSQQQNQYPHEPPSSVAVEATAQASIERARDYQRFVRQEAVRVYARIIGADWQRDGYLGGDTALGAQALESLRAAQAMWTTLHNEGLL